ncbi:family 3 glycoside hydrolase [Cryphonectria parasitica EP155]|uniref:beta-glucosidase n=1 Tax=Cryphonectria parasitica (strain ATCC 38755 / EP155) TaxID=660469 RepID=A0A9P4XZE2_CRYP1|nr:family 3 glycoside hydrolase [Cryphonectria parasitica EP155]KAF3763585.1 family 3 glycoside hydrolase [Cryphonectria parasitica EP155]
MKLAILAVVWALALPNSNALSDEDFYGQSPPVYPSPHGKGSGIWAPAYTAAHRLVGQMTLEEKVNITGGFSSPENTCHGNTGSVPRLGWPGMCLQDAGNGVRGVDLTNSYPSGIHVGASWDKNLTYLRGLEMGNEFRIKGANIALGPVAGPLGRTAVGGRNWEGFAVDPYLSGVLTAETIKGIQDAGIIANLKHLVANEQETWRRPYNGTEAASSNIDDRTLHELYLWPFIDGVKAGAASLMCSYNRVNNSYGCQNSKLLNGILKTDLEFQGFVMSDWHGQHSGVASALAGMDMVMPEEGFWGSSLIQAVKNGSVPEYRVTDMATRIIAAWYLLGQDSTDFPRPGVGIQNLSLPHPLIDARSPEADAILLKGAIAGHVLVKNVDNALPLGKPTMLSIFGYDAKPPPSKNIGELFELGYESQPEMARAELGYEAHFSQWAAQGVLFAGGRSGSNGPAYIDAPFGALTQRAKKDGTYLNWDFRSGNPMVNPMSDACLVFINAMATEGWDRDGLHDDFSDGLVLNVASKCANTIVIVHTAGIRLVDQWIQHPNVTAAIIAHLPGQELGEALVKIMYGEVSPSGKLPYTLAKNESDYGNLYEPCLPASLDDHFPQCDYTEGVYIDYRYFDAKKIEPRFEFGFGLSYTSFQYESLSAQAPGLSGNPLQKPIAKGSLWDVITSVSIKITNTGKFAAEEIAQLYVGIPNAPEKQLRGFEKVYLAPGEEAEVVFELTRRDLSVWDVVSQEWLVQRGQYKLFVGSSSRDIRWEGFHTIG